MRVRRLQTRFILAGALLVTTTVVCGIWSALTFAHLSTGVGPTVREYEGTIDLTAVLAGALEREDDALLLAVNGDAARARQDLVSQRQRFDEFYRRLLESLRDREEQAAALALRQHVDAYRAAGDALLVTVG